MTVTEFRVFQGQFFQALRDRPLDLSHPEDELLYEPLHDEEHDPVRRLYDTIVFSKIESVQLVPGFRGTGKTTEFSRLERQLWSDNYLVMRIDLGEFLDLRSPLEVVDFLLILASAITEKLSDVRLLGPDNPIAARFMQRVTGLLAQEQQLDLLTGTPDALRTGLRDDEELRGRVRRTLANKLTRLSRELRGHHGELLKALRERHGARRLVIIVDSLEQLRGTDETADAVHRSVEDLFFVHGKLLSLPETHLIMSVPAFLALKGDNLAAEFVNGQVQTWPACRVRDHRGEKIPETLDRLAALVEKRGDWRRILPDREALDALIIGSGGYLRDLINMLIEAIHLAGRGVRPDAASKAMAVMRRSYLPLYADERRVLKRIMDTRSLQAVESTDMRYVLRFLDSHLLLCYLNDEFWYDVHPLVREELQGS